MIEEENCKINCIRKWQVHLSSFTCVVWKSFSFFFDSWKKRRKTERERDWKKLCMRCDPISFYAYSFLSLSLFRTNDLILIFFSRDMLCEYVRYMVNLSNWPFNLKSLNIDTQILSFIQFLDTVKIFLHLDANGAHTSCEEEKRKWKKKD